MACHQWHLVAVISTAAALSKTAVTLVYTLQVSCSWRHFEENLKPYNFVVSYIS